MEPRKMVLMILCTEEQKRHRCKEQTLDSVDEGEDGMIWENKIETYILPYVSASWTYEAGHLELVLCDNLEETG